MKINIQETRPDGLLLNLSEIFVETYEDAFNIIKAVENVDSQEKKQPIVSDGKSNIGISASDSPDTHSQIKDEIDKDYLENMQDYFLKKNKELVKEKSEDKK